MKKDNIGVSICCITYNHAPYIRQCLEGFIMQKTTFRFEVWVHDDASTDGTSEIIREYVENYPEIIKPIYQTENQYQKKVGILKTFLFPRVRGRYIAMCEGDDYWTDPLKLQKQVDFLENNQEFALCCHGYMEFDEFNGRYNGWTPEDSEIITLNKFIDGDCCVTTLSVVFRHQLLLQSNYLKYKYQMDIPLFYSLLSLGLGFYMPDKMAVYRKHSGGVWSASCSSDKWTISFKAKMGILETESDEMASKYMYNFLLIPESRRTILKHLKDVCRGLTMINKYLGLKYVINVVNFIAFRRRFF